MTDQRTEQPPRELISRREFGRRKGWVPSYVVELCQAGKIPLFVECPAGCGSTCNVTAEACECGELIVGHVNTSRAKVDPVEAELALAAARHPEKQHVADRHAIARGDDQVDAELPLGSDEAGSNVTGFAHWKERSEKAKAETAELDLMRRRGELGRITDMRREAHNVAKALRESLTSIPDRLAPVLAAERDEARVHYLVLEEINRALDELYRKLGSDDTTAAAG